MKSNIVEPPDIEAYEAAERDSFLEGHEHLDEASDPFPLLKFSIAVLGQLALFLLLYSLVIPKIFHAELSHPLGIVLWTIACGIPFSLFEYFYHRYLLHSSVLPFMSS